MSALLHHTALFVAPTNEGTYKGNLTKIQGLLSEDSDEELYQKAEGYRNLGEFERCLTLLDKLQGTDLDWAKAPLIAACKGKKNSSLCTEKQFIGQGDSVCPQYAFCYGFVDKRRITSLTHQQVCTNLFQPINLNSIIKPCNNPFGLCPLCSIESIMNLGKRRSNGVFLWLNAKSSEKVTGSVLGPPCPSAHQSNMRPLSLLFRISRNL